MHCRELADQYVAASAELQSLIGAQKLHAMRHDFRSISDDDHRFAELNRKRHTILREVLAHIDERGCDAQSQAAAPD